MAFIYNFSFSMSDIVKSASLTIHWKTGARTLTVKWLPCANLMFLRYKCAEFKNSFPRDNYQPIGPEAINSAHEISIFGILP